MSSGPVTDIPASEKYGWTAVPRDVKLLLAQSEEYKSGPAPAFLVSDPKLALPESKLVTEVLEYAKRELPVETLHHSMRVWYYGMSTPPLPFIHGMNARSGRHCPLSKASKQASKLQPDTAWRSTVPRYTGRHDTNKTAGQAILAHAFPSWKSPSFDETYLLSSLLHDIGTTERNTAATRMSFEFYGGLLSLSLLGALAAPLAQAENVAETVMRHQDLGSSGTLTRIAALVQLATIFDNMGGNPELVSLRTVESVVREWPRRGWSKCFAGTVRREITLKPWAHTTHLGEREFPEGVEGNTLMAPYDE